YPYSAGLCATGTYLILVIVIKGIFLKKGGSMSVEMVVLRAIFILVLIAASYHLRPFHLSPAYSLLLGALLGALFVAFEIRLEKASLKRWIGTANGSILGILGALMIGHLQSFTAIERSSVALQQLTLRI